MKVLLFIDTHCRACKPLHAMLERFSERHGFAIQVFVLENDVAPFVAHGVTGVPVFIVMDENNEVGRFTGHQTHTSLEGNLRKFGVIE